MLLPSTVMPTWTEPITGVANGNFSLLKTYSTATPALAGNPIPSTSMPSRMPNDEESTKVFALLPTGLNAYVRSITVT